MFYRSCFILLISCVFLSCGKEASKSEYGTFLGGNIVNPVGNSVIIRKGDKFITEAELKPNNRFLIELPNFVPGLYEFLHKERQLVYLTEGDSVILRVNTLEFDESLTYSGYGGAKNNLMVDLFLMNERENEQMARNNIYHEPPNKFEHYLDSLQLIRDKRWQAFKDGNEATEDFINIAKAIINYDIYARKEVYPLTNYISSKIALINKMPKGFYDYRNEVSFNKEEFLPLYSYQRFLFNYFNQASFKKYGKKNAYDPQSLIHNKIELKIIDSVVTNGAIKSFLMTRNLKNFFSNSNDQKSNEEILELFLSFEPSSTDAKNIRDLYISNKNLEAGKKLPEEILLDDELNRKSLLGLINRPTILYFWSSENRDHMIRSHAKAEKLRQLYPQYTILDINLDIDKDRWLQTLKEQNFDDRFSYKFVDKIEELRRDFSINNILKTIILNEDAIILNAHANMFSSQFESEILGYLNNEDL